MRHLADSTGLVSTTESIADSLNTKEWNKTWRTAFKVTVDVNLSDNSFELRTQITTVPFKPLFEQNV